MGVKTGVSGEWAGASPATGLARPCTSHVRAESRWVFPDRQLGLVALGCGPSATSADESWAAICPPCWGQGAPSCQGGLSKHLRGSLAPLLRQTHRETGSSTLHGTSPWREATSSPRRGGAQALRRAQRGTWHPLPPQPLSLCTSCHEMTHVGCSVQLGPGAQEHPVPSPAKAPRSPHEAPMSPSAPTMDPWGGRSPLPMAAPCPPYPCPRAGCRPGPPRGVRGFC